MILKVRKIQLLKIIENNNDKRIQKTTYINNVLNKKENKQDLYYKKNCVKKCLKFMTFIF